MRILFLTPSYKPAYVYGGPTISVSQLAEALAACGHSVTVYTTTANGNTELDVPLARAIQMEGVEVYYFKRITRDHSHISPSLWKHLSGSVKKFDVVHLHSWWSILIMGAAMICKRNGVGYIISPRGMLASYTFSHQKNTLKKTIHSLFGKNLLAKSILHATTLQEWNDCHMVLPEWKGFILPNLVELPDASEKTLYVQKKILTIGFLSRIDRKKGIEYMLNALAKVKFEFRFLIAGTGDTDYINSLKELCVKLGIEQKVEWCGWMDREKKFWFLEQLDLFVLTSFNENFANAVIESLSVGCPVLVSKYVGLSDYVQEKGLGWVCEMNEGSIADQLESIQINNEQLNHIRKMAPGIIRDDFNQQRLAEKYTRAYEENIFSKKITETV